MSMLFYLTNDWLRWSFEETVWRGVSSRLSIRTTDMIEYLNEMKIVDDEEWFFPVGRP